MYVLLGEKIVILSPSKIDIPTRGNLLEQSKLKDEIEIVIKKKIEE